MGSLFGGPKIPTPPPPPPVSTVRDEVGGVEQVPVVNADGSTTYVTRRIPLTAEQQAQQNELDGVLNSALDEIRKLSASDYQDNPETKQVLDQWQQTQDRLLKQNFTERSQSEEQALARRGLSDSSIAEDVRRQRLLDKQDAERNVSQGRDELSNQIRSDRLGLQQNLYNLAAGQRDAEQARVLQSAVRSQSSGAALAAQRQASLLDYYDRNVAAQNGNSIFGGALGRGLGSSLGGSLGTSVGGPAGASIGSFFGQRFFGG